MKTTDRLGHKLAAIVGFMAEHASEDYHFELVQLMALMRQIEELESELRCARERLAVVDQERAMQ